MKKTLLMMIATLFAISLFGQPVAKKAQITGFQKLQDLENLQNLLVAAQKLDSTITESGNGSPWIFSNRIRYTYSVVGLTTTTISEMNLSPTGLAWVNTGKTETTVDVGGNTTLVIDYTWSGSAWVGSIKIEYTYSGGNLASNSTYTYNTGTSLWEGLFRTEYTYTGGNLTTDIGKTWDNAIPGWVNSTRTDYSYPGGLLASDLSYDWDNIGSSWGIPVEKTEYTYGGDMKLASVTSSLWDTDLSDWVNSTKTDYTYDTGGRQNSYLVSSWIGGVWVNASKMESEYNDPDGRITLFRLFTWNAGASTWFGILQNETSYGVLGLKTYAITIGSGWDFISSLWTPQSRSTKWYSDLTTGINTISEKKLNVYPNPVKDYIVFDNVNISESAKITIFDIQGRKVMEQQLSGNNQVVVSKLRKGLYFYKLSADGLTWSGKLLKN